MRFIAPNQLIAPGPGPESDAVQRTTATGRHDLLINEGSMVAESSAAAMSTDLAQPEAGQAEEKVLCEHCLRTSNNGIRCMGMCVADSDY